MPDFNGDGRDDILWWGPNGAISNWLGQAGGAWLINDAAAMRNVDPGGYWEILGTGDFNGDGRDDILWISDGNEISNWLGTEPGGWIVNDANALTFLGDIQAQPDWGFIATGDFNQDGRDDVLWGKAGGLIVWAGTAAGGWAGGPAIQQVSGWFVSHVGDFNGDGRDDLLMRNAAGAVSTQLALPGGGFASAVSGVSPDIPQDWIIQGTGDFNGDGRDDILWRNWQTGALSNWLGTGAGGFVINDANALVVVPTDWFIAGVGDYDGDGRDDILWRNHNGALSNWLGTDSGGWIINDANAYAQVEWGWQVGSNFDPWDY